MTSGPDATVVVVNYNGERLLPMCLDALRRQSFTSFTTVVVDNASVDGSLQLLARDYPEVRVLRSEVNTGFAGGNNLALREVGTPFVVLLNNDAAPRPDWLAELLTPLRAPDGADVGAVTSKIVFLPRFVEIGFATQGFRPGPQDPRELGLRWYGVSVDGRDVTGEVLWGADAYGPEAVGGQSFRWSRPAGRLLVPVPDDGAEHVVTVRWLAERDKDVQVRVAGAPPSELRATAGDAPTQHDVAVPAGARTVDVVNNAGGVVFADGYGADRGYQEVDDGRFDTAEDVFLFCGAAVALRSSALQDVGLFDDDFFLYYEDTDLSWRLGSRGYRIRYQPTAVVRHVHSATSQEWSPLFTFHVDRNRLLLLTKNATPGLAAWEVVRYPLTTASMLARALLAWARERRRPPLRRFALRAQVIASYLRLLPRMLARRREIRRRAVRSRAELQRWLVPR